MRNYDHLPSLALLKQTKLLDNKPIEFENQNLTAGKQGKDDQSRTTKVDWTRYLSSENSTDNFDLFSAKVNEIMDSISPCKKDPNCYKKKIHRTLDD